MTLTSHCLLFWVDLCHQQMKYFHPRTFALASPPPPVRFRQLRRSLNSSEVWVQTHLTPSDPPFILSTVAITSCHPSVHTFLHHTNFLWFPVHTFLHTSCDPPIYTLLPTSCHPSVHTFLHHTNSSGSQFILFLHTSYEHPPSLHFSFTPPVTPIHTFTCPIDSSVHTFLHIFYEPSFTHSFTPPMTSHSHFPLLYQPP